MDIFPLANIIKIKKRGCANWECVSLFDAPEFFENLIKVIGYDKLQEITGNGYIPF